MTLPPRLLGTTGLSVTPLGLGLAALGRPGYINLGHAADLAYDYDVAAMEARAHAVLDATWAAGVRYFDAARSYGRAEEFLGRWLAARRIPPGAVTVGSKWGKRSRGEGDGRTVGARDRDGHSAAIVAVRNTGRSPCFNAALRPAWGTTFCPCFSPRRGPTQHDDRMLRRVGPERAGELGFAA